MEQDKILFLGPEDSPLFAWLKDLGEPVIQTTDIISKKLIKDEKVGFLLSYGYQHIIRKDFLDMLPNRAINLHISYLPWNRGADPNFWSFVEGTPKGVTIHYLDAGLDTGDIIVQKKVHFDLQKETLTTSYNKLHIAIQDLFKKHWWDIKKGVCPRRKQVGESSEHKVKDKEKFLHLLKKGWDTQVSVLVTDEKENY